MTVSGKVALRPIDPAHLLDVKSVTVTVKCRESRTFGGKEERTLWEKSKTVWTPEGEYEQLGFWSKSFAMTIPTDAIKFGKSTQKTKEWKTVWRLDLVVEHKPIQFVGHSIIKTYGLNLYNHTSPSVPPPSPPQGLSIGHDNYSTQVCINAPHGAFGPGDSFTLSFYAKPDDPNTTIKKASVTLERRIETRERSPSPPSGSTSLPSSSTSNSTSTSNEKGGGSLFRRNISPRPFYDRLSSSNSSESSERALVNKIIDASTDQVVPGSGGTTWCHMHLALQKRGGHWDIAETCRSDIVSVTFDLKVKIWIKSGRTTREFNCPPLPILIAGVSMSERVAAQNAASAAASAAVAAADAAAQALLVPVTPHKRKHRSSRRGLYMHEGTLDITEDLLGSSLPATPVELMRRAKPKSISERSVSSPVSSILPITGVVTDIRPILRASNLSNTTNTNPITTDIKTNTNTSTSTSTTTTNRLTIITPTSRVPNPPSISFMFPSILGGHPETPVTRQTLPPIQTLLDDRPNTSYSESYSIIQQFQHSGRRVSTTASEEDDQPLRSRPKLEFTLPTPTTKTNESGDFSHGLSHGSGSGTGNGNGNGHGHGGGHANGRGENRNGNGNGRRALPSLDALGLGLPFVPDDERPRSRPRTAPMVSTFARHVPPPLSGQLSADVNDDRPEQIRPTSLATSHPSVGRSTSGTFAFGLPTVPGPPLARQ